MDPLIMTAISAGAQGANTMFTASNNKKQREWNEKMYAMQRKDALSDFAMQNEYNSPAQQMARLKAAGLNPNLVYGHGADAGIAGPVRQTDVKAWNPQTPQIDANGIVSTLLNSEVKTAQSDNLKAQNAVILEDAKLRAAQTLAVLANIDKTKLETGIKSELKDTYIESAKVNLQNLLKQGEGLSIRNEQMQTQTEKIRQDIQFTIDENTRKWQMQNYSVQQAAQDILLKQKMQAKTQAETDRIQKMIDYLDNQIRISGKQAEIWERGQNPNDPAWQRLLLELLQKVITKFSGEKPWWFPG